MQIKIPAILNLKFSKIKIFFISFLFFLILISNLSNSLAQTAGIRVRIPVTDDGQRLGDITIGGSVGGGGGPVGPGGYGPGGPGYSPTSASGCKSVDESGVATFGGIGCLISNFTNNVVAMLVILFGAAALATFLWGMVIFIKDADIPAEQKKGQDRMMWGLAALFVMVSVWGIVRMFQGFLGVDRRETQVVLPSVCTSPYGCDGEGRHISNSAPLDPAPSGRIDANKKSPTEPGKKQSETPTKTPKDPNACNKFTNPCRSGFTCSDYIGEGTCKKDKVSDKAYRLKEPCGYIQSITSKYEATCPGDLNMSCQKLPGATVDTCEYDKPEGDTEHVGKGQACGAMPWQGTCIKPYVCSSFIFAGTCVKQEDYGKEDMAEPGYLGGPCKSEGKKCLSLDLRCSTNNICEPALGALNGACSVDDTCREGLTCQTSLFGNNTCVKAQSSQSTTSGGLENSDQPF